MRIITLEQFIKLPSGVLYSEYEPCIFGDLRIKGDSMGKNDWGMQQIHDSLDFNSSTEQMDALLAEPKAGKSLPMNFDYQGRNGMFPRPESLYAVWERDDIEKLIERLDRCVAPEIP